MAAIRGAAGAASFLARAVRSTKVTMPVKSFRFYPIVPPGTQSLPGQAREMRGLIKEINPDLVLPDGIEDWRASVMSDFVEGIVKGCLSKPLVNPRKIGPLEAYKLRRRMKDLGVRASALPDGLKRRDSVFDVISSLKQAFIDSALGVSELAVFVESSESAKIQMPIFDEEHEIPLVDLKFMKLMSRYTDLFIDRHLNPYFERRWNIAGAARSLSLAVLAFDYKGDEVVNYYLRSVGAGEIGLLEYAAATKPALLFLVGVLNNYINDINLNWNSAFSSAKAVEELGQMLGHDLQSDSHELRSALRAFERTGDSGWLKPVFLRLNGAIGSEDPSERLKEALGQMVSDLKDFKEISVLPRALRAYFSSLSKTDREHFVRALWKIAAATPTSIERSDAVLNEKIIIVNLSPTINVKWKFDEEGREWFSAEATPSGRGVNSAMALRALGIDPVILGVRGGEVGERYVDLLKHIGLDAENFVRTADETRLFHILNPSDEIVIDDPPMRLTKEEFAELKAKLVERVSEGAIVLLSTGLPKGKFPLFSVENSFKQLIDELKAKGAKVFVDSRQDGLSAAYRAKADLIKCNLKEFVEFAEIKKDNASDLRSVAAQMRRIVSHGVPKVIVTLGKDGAMLATEDGVMHVSVPSVEVLNSVGSGDTLLAAFTKKISEGEGPFEAFRFATAVATASVTRSSTGLTGEIEREELLRKVEDIMKKSSVRMADKIE